MTAPNIELISIILQNLAQELKEQDITYLNFNSLRFNFNFNYQ